MSIVVKPAAQTVPVIVTTAPSIPIVSAPTRSVNVSVPLGKQGIQGEPGPPGKDAEWDSMTLAEYQDLLTKDPNTLYVIIG
jgi:hypothetical protein